MDEQDRLRSTPYYKARVEQREILRSFDSIGGFIQHADSQTSGLFSALFNPFGAAVKELEERESAERLADQDFEHPSAGPQSSLPSADTKTSAPEITQAPPVEVNPPRPEKATPTERHAALVAKLKRHIKKGKAGQSNYFSSKDAFSEH